MFLRHLAHRAAIDFAVRDLRHVHIKNTWTLEPPRGAGVCLFIVSLLVLGTGVALMRVGVQSQSATGRATDHWMHVICPLLAIWLYWLHRRRAADQVDGSELCGSVAACIAIVLMHRADPRLWNGRAKEARNISSVLGASTGNFIPADTLMMDNFASNVSGQFQG
jgi:hypothetical protein